MDSATITDHGVMYGVIDFYRAAKAEGIKPIIGCEVYVAPNSRSDKELTGGDDRYYHLVLLAENNVGYANLMKVFNFCLKIMSCLIGKTLFFMQKHRINNNGKEIITPGT